MKIDWSGARVLTTLITAVIGFALGLSSGGSGDGLVAILLAAVLGFGAWWIFPKIVKEA